MQFIDKSITEFTTELASKAAVPGGGGASALVAAVGMALGSMVGSLTIGKKKYADVEDEIKTLMEKAQALQTEFLRLVDEDAVVFEPLSKAYGIPKDDPTRETVMEDALKLATSVPLDIMRLSARAIELLDEFAKKGSRLALSDAGVGAAFCKAAIEGASLNVFINTKYMTNRDYAKSIEAEAEAILAKYCKVADEILSNVTSELRKS
ncbi:MAG: cyclodeaminase/cyclohydrolase family protein [Oscillospiraceae bacterium]|nr:cyclodeaminase/cyclohydrolase family protein [Oscillospiraceae bacterium]MCL2279552.1 cyclodeaminase/cyclohydrolase family protein [Oscillospiraceae bacterium]